MKKTNLIFIIISLLCLSGCQKDQTPTSPNKEIRDNTPHVLEPVASNQNVIGNDLVDIDISNSAQGYVMVNYLGTNTKVKVRITLPNSSEPYTYDKHSGYETFPLTGGSGTYQISIFENVSGTKYTPIFTQDIEVSLEDEFLPFLYPNQYVNFNKDSKAIEKGKELAAEATSDLEVVQNIYNYVIKNIKYDDSKAEQVTQGNLNGYLPNVDSILVEKTGICFDYAAVVATMLRSQGIPTKMQIGYALTPDSENGIYHAWIGIYLKETGWIDNLIQFDGNSWKMLDPTFASEGNDAATRKFISDETNYLTKYYY